MASWADLKDYIASSGNGMEVMDSGGLKVLVELEGSRSQLVFVLPPMDFAGQRLVGFRSPVASTNEVKPEHLFAASNLFGVVEGAGLYMLTHTVILDTLDAEEAAFALFALAVSADQVEKSVVGGDRL